MKKAEKPIDNYHLFDLSLASGIFAHAAAGGARVPRTIVLGLRLLLPSAVDEGPQAVGRPLERGLGPAASAPFRRPGFVTLLLRIGREIWKTFVVDHTNTSFAKSGGAALGGRLRHHRRNGEMLGEGLRLFLDIVWFKRRYSRDFSMSVQNCSFLKTFIDCGLAEGLHVARLLLCGRAVRDFIDGRVGPKRGCPNEMQSQAFSANLELSPLQWTTMRRIDRIDCINE